MKIIIWPERKSEYHEVNNLIFSAFSEQYGIFHENREKWGDEGYMVRLLREGALDGVKGTTSYYGG